MLYTKSCIERLKKQVEKALIKFHSNTDKIPLKVRKEIVENNLIEFLSSMPIKKSRCD